LTERPADPSAPDAKDETPHMTMYVAKRATEVPKEVEEELKQGVATATAATASNM